MKKRLARLVALFLIFALTICPMTAFAAAGDPGVSPQASNYINSTYAQITNKSGTITVGFSIAGTGYMTRIGATQIQVKNSSGAVVKTFHYSTTDGMMASGAYTHSGSVSFQGSASGKYYAVVSFRAGNGTGYDTDTYVTGYC